MAGIKSLMDDIIKDTDNKYSDDEKCYDKFDKDGFRERLSMFVLKDIISAMMAHQTDGLDKMIDNSILDHIHKDYKGTCFGYLCNARDKCKSPLIADIIQEIEDKTNEVAEECAITKNDYVSEAADVKEMLKGVEDYDSFVEKLASEVSQKVVDDVAGLLTDAGGAKAPTFSNLDDKIDLTPANETPADSSDASADSTNAETTTDENTEGEEPSAEAPTEGEGTAPETTTEEAEPAIATSTTVDTTPAPSVDVSSAASTPDVSSMNINTESSVILTMCGNIVLEQALNGNKISTEEGIERAVVQYCLAEMDCLFKQPSTVYGRYYRS